MNVSNKNDVRQLYDTSASKYDAMMDQEIKLPLYDFVIREMAQSIDELPGTILDTSCGSGQMLQKIGSEYCQDRELIGIDLSPEMVRLSKKKLENVAKIYEGDMAAIPQVANSTCAAVISFFAIHHVDPQQLETCCKEWQRVLVPGGQLILAAWEGTGNVDYGDTSDVIARCYTLPELSSTLSTIGLQITRQSVDPVEEMGMNSVHIVANKPTLL